MSIFSAIPDKLGLKKEQPTAGTAAAATPPQTAGATAVKPVAAAPAPAPRPSAAPMNAPIEDMKHEAAVSKPVAISEVDVVKQLEAKAKGTGLNWKQSISDLLFLLEIANSREARTELAKELGCPPEFMNDSAKMNTWLHKTVLKKIAENGGNIPKELLD
jgi:uncharacterized protein DUF3597